jgi:hypothetical protein
MRPVGADMMIVDPFLAGEDGLKSLAVEVAVVDLVPGVRQGLHRTMVKRGYEAVLDRMSVDYQEAHELYRTSADCLGYRWSQER